MGFFDPNGVWLYEETDLAADATFSGMLNKLGSSVSDKFEEIEGQLEDTGWIQITALETGWSAGSIPPMVRRRGGVVFFAGHVNKATGASVTICTLPAGFWPEHSRTFWLDCSGTQFRFTISSSGQMALNSTITTFGNAQLGDISPYLAAS